MIQKKSLRLWVYLILFAGIVFSFSFMFTLHLSLNSAHDISLAQTKTDLKTFSVSVSSVIADKYKSMDDKDGGLSFMTESFDKMLKNAAGFNRDFRISLIDESGLVVADSDSHDISLMENHKYRREVMDALQGDEGTALRKSTVSGNEVLYYATPMELGEKKYVLRLSMPLDVNVFESSGIQSKMTAAFAIVLAVSLGFSFLVSAKLIRQILKLQYTADEYATGNFAYRPDITSPKELVALSSSLEKMASQIQNNISDISRSRDDFQAVFSSITEGLIVFNNDMIVLAYNDSAEKFFAVNMKDALGKPLIQVVRNTDIQSLVNKTITESCVSEDISVRIFHSAQIYDLLVRCVPIKSYAENCDSKRFLLIAADITRLNQLEQIRKDFVANVSHELKTPVTSIKGFAETLLENPTDNPEEQRKFLKIIDSQTKRLGDIIDDLLTLSKLDQGTNLPEVMPTDIASVMKIICSGFKKQADEKNIRIDFFCEKNLPLIDINQALFQHAAENLIDNAVKYCPSGAEIKCSVLPVTVFHDKEGGDEKDKGVLIVIEDSGSGIPDIYKERIFERFFRIDKGRSREQGGTGLGLSIVRHIINIHGGVIKAVNRPDGKQGARFEILLPASKS